MSTCMYLCAYGACMYGYMHGKTVAYMHALQTNTGSGSNKNYTRCMVMGERKATLLTAMHAAIACPLLDDVVYETVSRHVYKFMCIYIHILHMIHRENPQQSARS